MPPVFEMRGISKAFPGVRALDDVSFSCQAGEVHALVGENGAGKSTLMKILSGAYQPDSGSLKIGGEDVRFSHPVEALHAGISVIYQEFSLLPDRTVAENIFLGREPVNRGMIDRARMNRETSKVLELFGGVHRISPDSLLSDLGVAEQQLVEIAKAVALDAKVIVMDEPTASLNEHECQVLFDLVDKLREQNHAIVYITHRMPEIARLANRVTVLKDGKVAAEYAEAPDAATIIRAMVGRDIGDFYPPPAKPEELGDVLMSVRNGGNHRLSGINLDLRAGEIVGFAGIQGAGRAALAMALFGDDPFESGEVALNGSKVHFSTPREAIRAGVGLLPGDRKGEGLLLMQSVRDNAMLTARAMSPMSGSHGKTRYGDSNHMDGLLDQLDVRASSYEQEIRTLSGGNQQ